ncbi:hypothetical protein MIND_00629100 [Mycena indigotica]|uniref:Uncharacterized protein n=1 Tax=Mycena indigotica TaxID=2126181 RepID=A0A8H6SR60_9AGAR|nr:uncharacterized protein MIND_00629100 [Mycena indigotica]KAF7303981.1 hypothetical protein MIND_00629100 [Mycena indigotica]
MSPRGRTSLTTLVVGVVLFSLLWIDRAERTLLPGRDKTEALLSPELPGHDRHLNESRASFAHYLFPVNDPEHADIWELENRRTVQALFTCLEESNCAENQTKVVLLDSFHFRGALLGWDGGEDLWARSTVLALNSLSYSILYSAVDLQRTIQLYRTFPTLIIMVILNPDDVDRCFNSPNIMCHKTTNNPEGIPAWKIFSFNWWTVGSHLLDERWILSPEKYRGLGENHTYFGYSVETSCETRTFVPHEDRRAHPQIYVMGKNGRYFTAGHRAWEPQELELAAAAIQQRSIVSPEAQEDARQVLFLAGLREDELPDDFIRGENGGSEWIMRNLGHLTPTKFYDTLAKSVALVGMGAPGTSPTPYDALCLGVPFINPIHIWDHADPSNRLGWAAQHETLKFLDPPYVYNIFVGDTHGFVDALKSAIDDPIESFVPETMRMPSIEERVGRILRTDWEEAAHELVEGRRLMGEGKINEAIPKAFQVKSCLTGNPDQPSTIRSYQFALPLQANTVISVSRYHLSGPQGVVGGTLRITTSTKLPSNSARIVVVPASLGYATVCSLAPKRGSDTSTAAFGVFATGPEDAASEHVNMTLILPASTNLAGLQTTLPNFAYNIDDLIGAGVDFVGAAFITGGEKPIMVKSISAPSRLLLSTWNASVSVGLARSSALDVSTGSDHFSSHVNASISGRYESNNLRLITGNAPINADVSLAPGFGGVDAYTSNSSLSLNISSLTSNTNDDPPLYLRLRAVTTDGAATVRLPVEYEGHFRLSGASARVREPKRQGDLRKVEYHYHGPALVATAAEGDSQAVEGTREEDQDTDDHEEELVTGSVYLTEEGIERGWVSVLAAGAGARLVL